MKTCVFGENMSILANGVQQSKFVSKGGSNKGTPLHLSCSLWWSRGLIDWWKMWWTKHFLARKWRICYVLWINLGKLLELESRLAWFWERFGVEGEFWKSCLIRVNVEQKDFLLWLSISWIPLNIRKEDDVENSSLSKFYFLLQDDVMWLKWCLWLVLFQIYTTFD